MADICQLYADAPALAEQGIAVISCAELTGIQALERLHPGLPLAPGMVERREFEYQRHGTVTGIMSRNVATGQVVAPSLGPTRTEADFLAHIQGVVASDPSVRQWHFVVDNLNTHQSASLVAYVAQVSGITADLGIKEKHGILHNQASRAAFLTDQSHQIVFHAPPNTVHG